MRAMDSPSPYQAPASAPPPVPLATGGEPSAVKVFGILHLVLAAIGLLTGLWTLISLKFADVFTKQAGAEFAKAQAAYMDEIAWVSVMTGIFLLLLAGLLAVAGLKLVRSRPDGVAWSHRYAWTSIATKLVSLVVTVVVVLPATQRMMGEIMASGPGAPGGAEQTVTTVMRVTTSVSTVASPLISCLYPALALFFLSRQPVKDWVGAGD